MAEETTPTITDVAQGPEPTPSVAALLRKGYEQAQQERNPKEIQLFGYGESNDPPSELWVTFRCLDDYEEVRDALRKKVASRGLKPAQLEVAMAIETLALAAVGSYALVDGEKHDIGLPLGLALYGHLFPDQTGPTNDAQAISMLFHNRTLPIMTAYTALDWWIKRGGQESEDAVLGE